MGHPWYAFYPKDYRDKTSGLTMIQDGAYRRLMDEYYITGEPLQANASVLLRVCRAFDDAERAAVMFILEKFFVLGDDGWHHLRIDEEIVRRAALSQVRSDAGKNGAERRLNKSKTFAQANRKQLPTQSHTQDYKSSLRSDLSPAKPKRRALSSLPDDCPSEKDRRAAQEFWASKTRADLSENLADIAESFRDNHLQKASRMADWAAAWRTWYRNALRFNRAPNASPFPTAKILKVV